MAALPEFLIWLAILPTDACDLGQSALLFTCTVRWLAPARMACEQSRNHPYDHSIAGLLAISSSQSDRAPRSRSVANRT